MGRYRMAHSEECPGDLVQHSGDYGCIYKVVSNVELHFYGLAIHLYKLIITSS